MKMSKDLPEIKEIIQLLLAYGDAINMSLIDYHENVYGRKVTASYYSTDGILEKYHTIAIFTEEENTLVQIDHSLFDYIEFKKRFKNETRRIQRGRLTL